MTQLRTIRELFGFTQEEMASAMGISKGLWVKWERGEQRITAAPRHLLSILLMWDYEGTLEKNLKKLHSIETNFPLHTRPPEILHIPEVLK